jgi:hypothetical protein
MKIPWSRAGFERQRPRKTAPVVIVNLARPRFWGIRALGSLKVGGPTGRGARSSGSRAM